MVNMQKIFIDMKQKMTQIENLGKVASYIPALSSVDPEKFGIHLATVKGDNYGLGDVDEKFSIQSIAKVFSMTLAFKLEENALWKRVGVEPSGTSFNSLVQVEYEKGIPRNPLINAGALVVCDILISSLKNPGNELLEFVRKISGNQTINYCSDIANSEKAGGYINVALVNLMKSFNNIHNDVEDVLNLYFNLCSIKMTCHELAHAFLFLAFEGTNPLTHEKIVTPSKTKRINAIMQLCGFYDEAGEFSFKVGLPGKSGVGGGIAAVYPGQYSIAVWSPRLNDKGNSYRGMKVLELLTTQTRASIF